LSPLEGRWVGFFYGAMAALEKLEKLCHVRACMFRAQEYVAGRNVTKEDAAAALEEGSLAITEMILEAKHE